MELIIDSPFRPCKARLVCQKEEVDFRGKTYKIESRYYVCDESGEQFDTSETSGLNISQVYDQYRKETGLPTPEELIDFRNQCGLTEEEMDAAMDFAHGTWHRIELGCMPTFDRIQQIKSAFADREKLTAAIEGSTVGQSKKG